MTSTNFLNQMSQMSDAFRQIREEAAQEFVNLTGRITELEEHIKGLEARCVELVGSNEVLQEQNIVLDQKVQAIRGLLGEVGASIAAATPVAPSVPVVPAAPHSSIEQGPISKAEEAVQETRMANHDSQADETPEVMEVARPAAPRRLAIKHRM